MNARLVVFVCVTLAVRRSAVSFLGVTNRVPAQMLIVNSAVLQPAGHSRAVDQRRQECRQMDALVLSRLCGEPGAVAGICAGVQPSRLLKKATWACLSCRDCGVWVHARRTERAA